MSQCTLWQYENVAALGVTETDDARPELEAKAHAGMHVIQNIYVFIGYGLYTKSQLQNKTLKTYC